MENTNFINGSNLVDGKIVINSNTKKVTEEEFVKYKKDLSDKTILLGINGTIGNVALYNNELCILGKSAAYLNINDDFDKQFVRYVLTNDHFQNYIKNNASGTTIKNVGLGLLREYEFSAPDLDTQRQIASILSSLDDKIELNLQMNQTLEAIAQAIFKEWFVPSTSSGQRKFNFPGFDGELVDGLPKGWKIGKLNDLIKILSGFAFKSIDFDDEGEYKLVTIKNVQDGLFDTQTTDKLNKLPAKMPDYCLLSEGNILLSLTGNVGRICIVTGENYLLNQRVAKLEPIRRKRQSFYIFSYA